LLWLLYTSVLGSHANRISYSLGRRRCKLRVAAKALALVENASEVGGTLLLLLNAELRGTRVAFRISRVVPQRLSVTLCCNSLKRSQSQRPLYYRDFERVDSFSFF
jgi:hypothetical protein